MEEENKEHFKEAIEETIEWYKNNEGSGRVVDKKRCRSTKGRTS